MQIKINFYSLANWLFYLQHYFKISKLRSIPTLYCFHPNQRGLQISFDSDVMISINWFLYFIIPTIYRIHHKSRFKENHSIQYINKCKISWNSSRFPTVMKLCAVKNNVFYWVVCLIIFLFIKIIMHDSREKATNTINTIFAIVMQLVR